MKHIAVDLDGTLAIYDPKDRNGAIGEPIPEMVQLVKNWISDGHVVWIFTARLSGLDYDDQYSKISLWLERQGIGDCDITNVKRREFAEFYDDKAYNVKRNEGLPCSKCSGQASWRVALQRLEDSTN
jgi:hypothetical protein